MDRGTKIFFAIVYVITTLILICVIFDATYNSLAVDMFPEIFMQYNWHTLPVLQSRIIRQAVMLVIPWFTIILNGFLMSSFCMIWFLVMDWKSNRRAK